MRDGFGVRSGGEGAIRCGLRQLRCPRHPPGHGIHVGYKFGRCSKDKGFRGGRWHMLDRAPVRPGMESGLAAATSFGRKAYEQIRANAGVFGHGIRRPVDNRKGPSDLAQAELLGRGTLYLLEDMGQMVEMAHHSHQRGVEAARLEGHSQVRRPRREGRGRRRSSHAGRTREGTLFLDPDIFPPAWSGRRRGSKSRPGGFFWRTS